jgi:hypothetical protein
MSTEYKELVIIVETWMARRHEYASKWEGGSNAASLREFVEAHNAMTRRLVSELQSQNPEFWSALYELAGNAETIIRNRKVFIDGQDVTNQV